jgi:hypothetical protein
MCVGWLTAAPIRRAATNSSRRVTGQVISNMDRACRRSPWRRADRHHAVRIPGIPVRRDGTRPTATGTVGSSWSGPRPRTSRWTWSTAPTDTRRRGLRVPPPVRPRHCRRSHQRNRSGARARPAGGWGLSGGQESRETGLLGSGGLAVSRGATDDACVTPAAWSARRPRRVRRLTTQHPSRHPAPRRPGVGPAERHGCDRSAPENRHRRSVAGPLVVSPGPERPHPRPPDGRWR